MDEGVEASPSQTHKSSLRLGFARLPQIWQFQQTHREILVNKENGVGLLRWEIGELASKIGQLYYHYYLRTSESSYLVEAAVFYSAILDRGYFDDFGEAASKDLEAKKLRFLARFAVVLVLLDSLVPSGMGSPTKTSSAGKQSRSHDIEHVASVLAESIAAYAAAYGEEDAGDVAEWTRVGSEIGAFVDARKAIVVAEGENVQHVSQALRIQVPNPTEFSSLIADALIVSNPGRDAVKFSEMTLDSYRMVLSLEAVPLAPETAVSVSLANPHKYVLYRPTVAQFLTFAATALAESRPSETLLVYFSGHGTSLPAPAELAIARNNNVAQAMDTEDPPTGADGEEDGGGEEGEENGSGDKTLSPVLPTLPSMLEVFGQGGVELAPAADTNEGEGSSWCDVVTPGDLAILGRRPLFCVVDTEGGASDFRVLAAAGAVWSMPSGLILAGEKAPPNWPASVGSPLTMFLTDPLAAFAIISEAEPMARDTYDMALSMVGTILDTIGSVLAEACAASPALAPLEFFARDAFLHRYLTRAIMYCATLATLKATEDSYAEYAPEILPALPHTVWQTSQVLESVLQLASVLSVTLKFSNVAMS